MPNIRQYEVDPRDAGVNPQGLEMGINALNQAAEHKASSAYRLSQYYTKAGEALGGGLSDIGKVAQTFVKDHESASEISTAQNLTSTLLVNETQGLSKFIQQHPNDAEAQQSYLTEMNTRIDSAYAGLKSQKGQEYGQKEAGEMKKHLTEVYLRDSSTAAGVQIKTNMEQSLNNVASTLDGTDMSEANANKIVERGVSAQIDANPMLVGGQADKAKEFSQTAHSAMALANAMKLTQTNPDALLARIKDGSFAAAPVGPNGETRASYLGPVHFQELTNRAEVAAKANLAAAAKANHEYAQDKTMKNFAQNAPGGMPTAKYFENLNEFAGETDNYGHSRFNLTELDQAKAAGIAALHEGQRVITDPAVHDIIRNHIWTDPATDDAHIGMPELDKLEMAGKLSAKDWGHYREISKDATANPAMAGDMKRFEQYYNGAVKNFIVDPLVPNSQAGARAEQLRQNALDQFVAGRNQGIPVTQLLDPDSPHSVFSRKLIQQSQPSDEEKASNASNMNPLPLPSLQKQHYDDVMKRLNADPALKAAMQRGQPSKE